MRDVRLRVVLLLTAAALLSGAAPPDARAEWSAPFDLSLPGDGRRNARVAVDPSGAAVAVWLAREGSDTLVQARRIEADGTLGSVLDVSAAGRIAAGPDVAIDAAGHATLVWSDRANGSPDEIVRARQLRATGGLEPTVDLTSAGHASRLPQVAVDSAGAVTVAWFRAPGTVHMRRIDPVGGPGATLDLSPPLSSQPDLAVDPSGDAYIAWATAGGGDQVIQVRRADAGGGLDPAVTLSDGDQLSFAPRIALDDAGTPTVAWSREDDSIELVRGLDAAAEPHVVAPAGSADDVDDLAVDAAGNATVAWRGPSGATQAVFLRRVTAAGTLGPVNDLWSGGSDGDPRLALDGAGNATLIWPNANAAGVGTIRARTAVPGSPFGPIAELSPASSDESVDEPRIASNADGRLTAVWRREIHGGDSAIVAARFTAAPESTVPAPAPAAPAAPDPVPDPPAPPACATATLTKVAPDARGPRASRRGGMKGVRVRVTLDRAARLDLISAVVTHTHAGRKRTATLRVRDVTAAARSSLRFRLPARLARELPLGRRVTLALKLRVLSDASGCPHGDARTFRLRTKVIRHAATGSAG